MDFGVLGVPGQLAQQPVVGELRHGQGDVPQPMQFVKDTDLKTNHVMSNHVHWVRENYLLCRDNSPLPANGGANCPDSKTSSQSCRSQACPIGKNSFNS